MPQYAILRFEKHKGGSSRAIEAHHERQKDKYASNPDIDTHRSNSNFHLIKPGKSYRLEIENRIETAGCKTRKDSVRFVDTLITASPEFFKGKNKSEIRAYFQRAVDFLSLRIGMCNIFTAVVHLDEKTPHMHLCFTPITDDGRLSAKDIIGNRIQLSKWQDDFFAHMLKSYPDLERGESASKTGRKHIPTRIFKEAANLTKQAKRIESILNDISPFNAGKKRDEVIALLKKFFPAMESFEGQIKKYKKSIVLLEKENAQLAQKAEAGAKNKIGVQLEIAKLQSENIELRKFCDSIPDEYKQMFRTIQPKAKQNEI